MEDEGLGESRKERTLYLLSNFINDTNKISSTIAVMTSCSPLMKLGKGAAFQNSKKPSIAKDSRPYCITEDH